jgi:hypothetical protein
MNISYTKRQAVFKIIFMGIYDFLLEVFNDGLKKKSSNVFNFILLILITILTSACEDRTFDKQKLILIKDIQSILVKEKMCKSVKTCSKHQFFFAGPVKKGISVILYNINDKVVIEKILEECKKLFFKTEHINIYFYVHKMSKQAELKLPLFKYSKPYITIKLTQK